MLEDADVAVALDILLDGSPELQLWAWAVLELAAPRCPYLVLNSKRSHSSSKHYTRFVSRSSCAGGGDFVSDHTKWLTVAGAVSRSGHAGSPNGRG
jgi:hypothetical protein